MQTCPDQKVKGLSMLLKLNQATALCGLDTFYPKPLEVYAKEALGWLGKQKYSPQLDAKGMATFIATFNMGGLIYYLLADPRRAADLTKHAIRFILRAADDLNQPEWHRLMVQPAINIARVYRSIGDIGQCFELLRTLHAITFSGKPGVLASVHLSREQARWIAETADEETRALVVHNCRIEELKCAITMGNHELLRAKTSSVWERMSKPDQEPSSFDLYLLELSLRHHLFDKTPDEMSKMISSCPPIPDWVGIYVVDAHHRAGCMEKARLACLHLFDKIVAKGQDSELSLLFALAIRLASFGEYEKAVHLAAQVKHSARETANDILLLRVHTLLALLHSATQSGSQARDALWQHLKDSRFNNERLIACAVVAANCHDTRFKTGMWHLSEAVSLATTILSPVVRFMETQTPPLPGKALGAGQSLEVTLPEAEQLYRKLKQLPISSDRVLVSSVTGSHSAKTKKPETV